MTNDLNFQWDNDEHLYLIRLAKNTNNNAMKDVECYLDFLSEIEPFKDTNIKDRKDKISIKFSL